MSRKVELCIYHNLCSGWELSYISETKHKQRLQNRLEQHKSAVQCGDQNHSGISKCLELGPGTDWKCTEIVTYSKVYFKERKFSKALVIKKHPKNCNRDRGVATPDIYNCITCKKI